VDVHLPGYDYVALAKAALEGVAAALQQRTAVFVLRTRQSTTGGYLEIFPEAARKLLERFECFAVAPSEVGDVVAAIASGLLDGLRPRVLTIDHGSARLDNTMTAATLLAELGR
jgi:enoyl-[acyl-carrier-protein] reductase (NADH)